MNVLKKLALVTPLLAIIATFPVIVTAQSTQSGSIGIEAVIPSEPPTTGATIAVPSDGQIFTQIPITVNGICPAGLLVKIFKNNVFAGSTECPGGSYSIQIDLFSGQNDLIARVYDALDQPGPDSNLVTVTFNDTTFGGFSSRPSLTSNYAKRGANPGERLEWPIILSGGTGPFAVSVDWGDGSSADLSSRSGSGEFTVSHIYEQAGVYNIIVKVTDANGTSGFLQLVGIANGAIIANTTADTTVKTRTNVLWWPLLLLFPLLPLSFWMGRRHEIFTLRKRLDDNPL